MKPNMCKWVNGFNRYLKYANLLEIKRYISTNLMKFVYGDKNGEFINR